MNLILNKRQIMAGKAEIQKKADNKVANNKNLNLAISGINKQFGPGALMKLGDATKMEVDKISAPACNKRV